MAGWIQTHSGRWLDVLHPDPDQIDIYDIAHALSMQVRWNGHLKWFYSVAQHCYHLTHFVPEKHRLWALLHDAPEAYLGDVVRPLKKELSRYYEIEERWMSAICEKYGLDPDMPAEVHDADMRICLDERAQLKKPDVHADRLKPDERVLAPLGVQIPHWQPDHAEYMYLRRFYDLTRQAFSPF